MDTHTIWFLAIWLSTLIAGVVGFALKLRQLKKTHLENEKLVLEITALKKAAATSEKRIMLATNEEVLRINHLEMPMFSRKSANNVDSPREMYRRSLKEISVIAAIVVVVLIVISYAMYDFYRLAVWIAGRF